LQITKSVRKSIASFVELTLPYIIASSPARGEGTLFISPPLRGGDAGEGE